MNSCQAECDDEVGEKIANEVTLGGDSNYIKTNAVQEVEANNEWKSSGQMKKRWKICLFFTSIVALLVIIAVLLLWYLQIFPKNIEYVEGQCAPIRIPLCAKNKLPYYYTIYPNKYGFESQNDAGENMLKYEALISVKCYELLPLLLCSLHAPKCIQKSHIVPPCKSLCTETIRRCEFFLPVFTVDWPSGMICEDFPDSPDPDVCVGQQQMRKLESDSKACTGKFRCDKTLCLQNHWVCDGYPDCADFSDEKNCSNCKQNEYYCGKNKCIDKKKYCDGIADCPDGIDERKCLRLSEKRGHFGEGRLDAYNLETNRWIPVCGERWNSTTMSSRACSLMGYDSANATMLKDDPSFMMENLSNISLIQSQPRMATIFGKRQLGCKEDPVYVYLKCNNFKCGRSANDMIPKASWRIVGGTESEPGQWPWLAAVHGGPDEIFFCGGVLVSEWWVLSAAHCVGNQSDITGWSLKLGMTRRTTDAAYIQKRGVADIIRHENFSSLSFYGNDIVLIRLDKPVTFDALLRPICLPEPNIPPTALRKCHVIGWGKPAHDDDLDYHPVIHQVEVPIVDFDTCSNWYSVQEVNISDTMLCAGFEEGKKDACQGDSGGPLLCKGRDHWFVAGVVSWGIKCAQPNLPGIYTNVPQYVDWILSSTMASGYPVDSWYLRT